MRKQFNTLISIILIAGLLMGFSQPNTGSIAEPSQTLINEVSIADLDNLINQFKDEGEFKNKGVAQSLQSHLTNVERDADKADQRLDKLIDFIQQRQKVGHISENASTILLQHANALKIQLATAFDSNNVMDTIKDLSVDIGPRVAGSKEEKQAADYLKNRFEDYGYDVSIQEFAIRDTLKIQLTINDEELALGTASGSIETDENGVTGNLIDAGQGLTEDFSEDMSGNIAPIQRGENTYWEKVQSATEAGAIGVVIYDNVDSLTPVRPSLGSGNRSTIPVVGLQKVDGESLLPQINEGVVEANLYVRTQTNQISQNVVAVKKPDNVVNPEIVYVTAHYDSVPFSPGANDDGSGTAAIVELARVMAKLPSDKEFRVIAFGAEEIGLVGSNYYVSQLSQEEIDRSAANFQLEMMGSAFEPGSYFAFNTVNGQENQIWHHTNAVFDNLGYDKDKLLLVRRGSSDHVPFHNVGIMATCFNMGTANGGLEPEYHTPHDTFDKISQDRIEFAGQIIKNTIFYYLADDAIGAQSLEEAS